MAGLFDSAALRQASLRAGNPSTRPPFDTPRSGQGRPWTGKPKGDRPGQASLRGTARGTGQVTVRPPQGSARGGQRPKDRSALVGQTLRARPQGRPFDSAVLRQASLRAGSAVVGQLRLGRPPTPRSGRSRPWHDKPARAGPSTRADRPSGRTLRLGRPPTGLAQGRTDRPWSGKPAGAPEATALAADPSRLRAIASPWIGQGRQVAPPTAIARGPAIRLGRLPASLAQAKQAVVAIAPARPSRATGTPTPRRIARGTHLRLQSRVEAGRFRPSAAAAGDTVRRLHLLGRRHGVPAAGLHAVAAGAAGFAPRKAAAAVGARVLHVLEHLRHHPHMPAAFWSPACGRSNDPMCRPRPRPSSSWALAASPHATGPGTSSRLSIPTAATRVLEAVRVFKLIGQALGHQLWRPR